MKIRTDRLVIVTLIAVGLLGLSGAIFVAINNTTNALSCRQAYQNYEAVGAAAAILFLNGVDLTPEEQKTWDRTIAEYKAACPKDE